MNKQLSLRRALSLLVLLASTLPLIGVALLLFFWLTPHLEHQAAENNRALATVISAQTEQFLTTPQHALRGLATHATDYRQQGQLQIALKSLIDASDLFEAVYIVDKKNRLIALSTPHGAHIQKDDYLGLDLSGSLTLQKARAKKDGIWSDAYLSPISNRSVAATAIPANDLLIVGEISLRRLSEFVRQMSGDQSTIVILDRRGLVVAHPDPRQTAEQINYSNLSVLQRTEASVTEKFRFDDNDVIGTLAHVKSLDWHVLVTQPLAAIQRPIMLTGAVLLILSLIGAAFSWWIGLTFARRVSSRFERLAELSEQLSAGHYPEQWPAQILLEAERLNSSLRRMSEAVHEREQDLRELNQTLEQKVEERTTHLKQAQETLIRSERLAALGSLVAGVAHELNTPIGNGLMAASSLEYMTKKFTARSREGMRRSELESHLAYNLEAVDLIRRNLTRAADLVSSFKQVSIDQTTSQRRTFDLTELIHEIITTLTPTIRKQHCTVQIEATNKICLDSYPGPLGQVLVNLLSNALVHAYLEHPGTINISTRSVAGERVELVVSDHGCGISDDHLRRIFDPFFTTRLGKGGSGLGLHISHNIVTNLLGGQIEVASNIDTGTCFTITLPCHAPLKEITDEGLVV